MDSFWYGYMLQPSSYLCFRAAPNFIFNFHSLAVVNYTNPIAPSFFSYGAVGPETPLTRLSELFNVNHFIVSQANPYIVPFMSRGLKDRKSGGSDRSGYSATMTERIARVILAEIKHRLGQVKRELKKETKMPCYIELRLTLLFPSIAIVEPSGNLAAYHCSVGGRKSVWKCYHCARGATTGFQDPDLQPNAQVNPVLDSEGRAVDLALLVHAQVPTHDRTGFRQDLAPAASRGVSIRHPGRNRERTASIWTGPSSQTKVRTQEAITQFALALHDTTRKQR